MKQYLSLTLLLALGSLTGCATRSAQGAQYAPAETGIVVTGEGRADAAPDLAVVRVGIEARRPTMAEAREANASAQARLLEAVRALGVASADIQTEQLSLQAEYDYTDAGRQLRGYLATNIVRVNVRDVSRAGAVVDATIAAGGDDARVDGVSFEIQDPTALRVEVRRRAVADARVKAEQLAAEIGATVGEPIFIEEVGVSAPGPVMMRMAAPSADHATPVEAGTLETNVSVRVRWAITH